MIRWILVTALLFAGFSAHAENPRLDIGQILVLSLDAPVAAVVVGNPKIVDVAVEGERAVLVFGKSAGLSDVVMLNAEHEVVYSARFTVAPAAEAKPPVEPPPPVAHRPAPKKQPVVIVRGPAEKGMSEVRWVCGDDGRCAKDAAR